MSRIILYWKFIEKGLTILKMKSIVLPDRQTNCLSVIRLIAALQVAYGHIVAHMSIDIPSLIGTVFGYFQGVPIFFLLSGFLIWDSIERSKDYSSYIKKRFWRIYPELWIGVLTEAIAIIIFYGIPNVKQFIMFIGTQATILQFWTPESLRLYGCGTPNGALWTVCVLIQFYIIIWFIRKLLHGRSYLIWGLTFLISIVLGMVPALLGGYLPEIVIKLYGQSVMNYLYLFLGGAFLAEFKSKFMSFVIKYWYILSFVSAILYITGIDIPNTSYKVIKGILCVYGLIGFAYTFPKLNICIDLSYGLYIYHMTVVNAMISLGLVGDVVYLAIALLVSIGFALISTMTIGKWSMKRKIKCRN